jgi:hypothetical protein
MSSSDGVDPSSAEANEGDKPTHPLVPIQPTSKLQRLNHVPSHISTIAEIAKSLQSSGVSQMAEIIRLQNRIFAEATHPKYTLSNYHSQFAQLRNLTSSVTEPFRVAQEALRSHAVMFEGLSTHYSKFKLAWSVASGVLSQRLNEIGLLDSLAYLLPMPNSFVRQPIG